VAARVDVELCTGCGACAEACPADVIRIQNGKAQVDVEACVECGLCVGECPVEAIRLD
jgi:ferredoxin